MREVSFEVLTEEPVSNSEPLIHSTNKNYVQVVSPDFQQKDSYHATRRNDQFVTICYNSRKKMFILIDSNGITTWEWQKLTNKINRVVNYPIKDSKLIRDCIYCQKYNCYFVLKSDNKLAVFNRDFDEVCYVKSSSTILCIIYNPVKDELLTSSLNGLKIWTLQPQIPNKSDSTKPLGHYELKLKKEIAFNEEWFKKIDIDSVNCQLYCCTERDLFIYDFNGNLIRHYAAMHKMAITCCVYSPTAKVVITGSADGDIKVWSSAGGLLETFRAHSLPISSLILNPHNTNLILSASLDGSIKMWSLDIMQQIYQLNLFKCEILWMGITEENLLYVASPYDVTIWTITNFLEFWAIARDKICRIEFDYVKGRSCRILTVSEENTVRIFNRDEAYQLTAVLPIPILSNKLRMLSIVYSRYYDIVYILLSNNELWLYYTKTNPCTHLVVLEVSSLLEKNDLISDDIIITNEETENKNGFNNNLLTAEVLRNHRAVAYNLDHLDKNEKCKCLCICLLDAEVIYWRPQGSLKPPTRNFLLLGIENGNVVFCDALTQTKKYLSLNCSKDPIVELAHDKLNNYLVVRVETAKLFHIQFYNLPELELKDEIFCPKTMTSYGRLNRKMMLGFSDGSLEMVEIQQVNTTESFNRVPNEVEIAEILNRHRKFEHKQCVEIIDTCKKLNLFLSCSYDGCIKLWNSCREPIVEIKLGNSLSYCRFLNFTGDMVCGYYNHIFKIVIKRILPEYVAKFENKTVDCYDDYNDTFIDDSVFIEESALQMEDSPDSPENQEQRPIKISLEKYLHPFDVRCDRNGVLRVHKPENAKKLTAMANQTLLSLKSKTDALEVKSIESFMSSLPDSFFETPRENPLANLKLVDLTIDSSVNQLDLRAYLVDWLSDSLATAAKFNHKQFIRDWRFPKFGDSPNSTPTYTPPLLNYSDNNKNEPTADDDIVNIVNYTKKEKEKLQKIFQDKLSVKLDKQIKEISEEDSDNQRTQNNNSKTDYRPVEIFKEKVESLNLGYRIVHNKPSTDAGLSVEQQESQRFQLSKHKPIDASISQERRTYSLLASTELKIHTKNQVPGNILQFKSTSLNNNNNNNKSLDSKRVNKRATSSHVTSAGQRQNKRPVSAVSQKSNRSHASSTTSKHQSTAYRRPPKNDHPNISSKSSPIFASEYAASIAENKQTSTPISTNRVSDAILSAKPPIIVRTGYKNHFEPAKTSGFEEQTTEKILQNSSRISVNTVDTEVSLSNSILNKDAKNREAEYDILARQSFMKNHQYTQRNASNRSSSRADSEYDRLDKARYLFEYLYGMKGTPVRIGRGQYRMPFGNESENSPMVDKIDGKIMKVDITEDKGDNNGKFVEKDDGSVNEEERQFIQFGSGTSLNNSVFGNWLADYEKKKNRLSHRMNRAKENYEYQNMKSQSLLLATINRKNSAVSRFSTLTSYRLKSRDSTSFITPNPSPRSDTVRSERALKVVLTSLTNQSKNFEHETKSAYRQLEPSLSSLAKPGETAKSFQCQKRSKSVSFVFDKPDVYLKSKCHSASNHQQPNDANSSVSNEQKSGVKIPKPIIRIQPAYLVSQIEMEDILNEALKKFEQNRIKMIVDDSGSLINTAFNNVNQETNIISASDSSDDEFENSFNLKGDLETNKSSNRETSNRSVKSSAVSLRSRPKSSSVYQMPSKLDNWTTEHRLSLKSAGSNTTKKCTGSNMSKLIEFSDSEEEDEEFTANTENYLKFERFQLERPRTANSIPNKNGKYIFMKAPELNLEYQLPNSPEKHLLPVRFPVLYSKIIKSITLYTKKLEKERALKKKEELTGIEIF